MAKSFGERNLGGTPALSRLTARPGPQRGSAALSCGKPPAFRPMLPHSLPSAQAGRLSLPACAEGVIQRGRPSERRSLSADQAAEPQVIVDRFERNLNAPGATPRLAPGQPPRPPLRPKVFAPRGPANASGDIRQLIHAAIIMDGNGRWAEERGLPRSAGHRAGVAAVHRSLEAAPDLGIGTLTLHAFSSDNWQRPAYEVRELMRIFEEFLRSSVAEWIGAGIRTSVIGRRDRLEPSLAVSIEAAESATLQGSRLHLRLAIDYSAREAILCAARSLAKCEAATPSQFARLLAAVEHNGAPVGSDLVYDQGPGLAPAQPAPRGGPTFDWGHYPPVAELDLLIRTGGEQRLSDFMLWECAYAELVFTERMWPDFDAADLEAAVREFRSRHRRFGRITESVLACAACCGARRSRA